MDYFINYKSCKVYYKSYNRNCKCAEYIRVWISQDGSAVNYMLGRGHHNNKGPAILIYHENGAIRIKYHYINNRRHNTKGPAIIEYSENGYIECLSYYLNDKWVWSYVLKY